MSNPSQTSTTTTTSDNDNKNIKDDTNSNNDAYDSNLLTKHKVPLPNIVVVHPLVLLSVVDHYHRVARDTNRRVIGILLGEQVSGQCDITNSFAIPFEEDNKDLDIWYIDRQYVEEMFAMFKKVNARERIIGWYTTGPKLKHNDIQITELLRNYCINPVCVVIDVQSKVNNVEIPTEAYMSIDIEPESQIISNSANALNNQTNIQSSTNEQKMDIDQNDSIHHNKNNNNYIQLNKQFIHIPTKIEALEAEEVGVEHLLRGITDINQSTLSDKINNQVNSLIGLHDRLYYIIKYLTAVQQNKLPVNQPILYKIQDIINLLPDFSINITNDILHSITLQTNDNYMIMYISTLVRAITALHDLINNKLLLRQIEQDETRKLNDERKKLRELKQKEQDENKEKAKHDNIDGVNDVEVKKHEKK